MNRWIILIATLLVTLGFSATIRTTLINPSISNLIISGSLMVIMIVGLIKFFKPNPTNLMRGSMDDYTPTN